MSGTPIIASGGSLAVIILLPALFCSDPSKSDWNFRHFRITGVWSAEATPGRKGDWHTLSTRECKCSVWRLL